MTFDGEFRGNAHERNHLHESPPVMTMPLVVLAVGAAVAGLVGIPGRSPSARPTSTSSTTSSSRSIAEIHGHESPRPPESRRRVGADRAVGGNRGGAASCSRGRIWGGTVGLARRRGAGRGASRRSTACSRTSTTSTSSTTPPWCAAPGGWRGCCRASTPRSSTALVNVARHFTVVTALLSGFFDRYVVDGLVNLVGYTLSQSSRAVPPAADRSGVAVRPGGRGRGAGAGVRRRYPAIRS